jgi:hypothetical protein
MPCCCAAPALCRAWAWRGRMLGCRRTVGRSPCTLMASGGLLMTCDATLDCTQKYFLPPLFLFDSHLCDAPYVPIPCT